MSSSPGESAVARPELIREPPTPAQLRNDVWLGLGLFAAAILSSVLGFFAQLMGTESLDARWGVLYGALIALPFVVRRRFPIAVAIVVNVVYIVGMEAGVPELYVGQVALFLTMYTIGAWSQNRRRALYARLGIIAAMFVWMLVATFRAATDAPNSDVAAVGVLSPVLAYMLIMWLVNVVFFGGAFYMGDRAYDAALNRQALAERTRQLEEQQELAAAQAVALDRVRIARELHDVVAHHVSAMGVQAGAARAVVDTDPAAAKRALAAVEASAREAIGELRHLLDTLRSGDAEEDEAPSTLGLESLDPLVRSVDEAGTPATLRVVGEQASVPAFVQVNLFRIAQEALTNARRHGGPNVRADVRVRYEPGAVELEVANTGRVVLASRAGLGTLGMRERATAMGARLEAGPRDGGGYLVRVRVPIAEAPGGGGWSA
ncbi:sensor histidine kinase [Microbacterium sp. ZXX196]|uniref:sensor histidine kinase n=1 Tax=Microbacterium sp. ZXX196 TaxID=2609291 RepID=UPI0012B94E98|nr:histidine kinase [Microbacterium sp. ZXX196]MTE24660.1 sensor histidine kinase [Microbacterium sp. ZXX196]